MIIIANLEVAVNKAIKDFDNIANAIEYKGINIPRDTDTSEYGELIKSINGGINTSDATATANDILTGKTAYVDGDKITGTIATQAAQTIVPTTSDKTIASGKYLAGKQTIKGDTNLVSGNIKSGVSLFGVSGSYTSDATATAADIANGVSAYVNGVKIIGTAIASGLKTYTSDVTVPAATSSITVNHGLNTTNILLAAIWVDDDFVTAPTANAAVSYVYLRSTMSNKNVASGTEHANLLLYQYYNATNGTVTGNVVSLASNFMNVADANSITFPRGSSQNFLANQPYKVLIVAE